MTDHELIIRPSPKFDTLSLVVAYCTCKNYASSPATESQATRAWQDHKNAKTWQAIDKFLADPSTGTLALSPGDDFEARVGWDDTLLLGGLYWAGKNVDGVTYWSQPGIVYLERYSATTAIRPGGRNTLYVVSTRTVFPPDEHITKFRAYAILHHGGSKTRAAVALRFLGYGTRTPRQPEPKAAQAVREHRSLQADLTNLLNRHSAENGSNTQDFVLAQFLVTVLDAFDCATRRRDRIQEEAEDDGA